MKLYHRLALAESTSARSSNDEGARRKALYLARPSWRRLADWSKHSASGDTSFCCVVAVVCLA